MRIIAKGRIYHGFAYHEKGAILDLPDHQAEGLIESGAAMSEEAAQAESKKTSSTVESTALESSPADTAMGSPNKKGKKPGFFKK